MESADSCNSAMNTLLAYILETCISISKECTIHLVSHTGNKIDLVLYFLLEDWLKKTYHLASRYKTRESYNNTKIMKKHTTQAKCYTYKISSKFRLWYYTCTNHFSGFPQNNIWFTTLSSRNQSGSECFKPVQLQTGNEIIIKCVSNRHLSSSSYTLTMH